jgi:hypothetical protein
MIHLSKITAGSPCLSTGIARESHRLQPGECQIVSGDNHLLKLRKFRGIKIINPKEMIDILGHSFPELICDF